MAILGNIIARSLRLRTQFKIKEASPKVYQQRVLRFLLERGQYTAFGKEYGFGKILSESIDLEEDFRKAVPMHDYQKMFDGWWYRCLEGEENVAWPGKVKYFALSSGTSESASKHIPVTQDMIRSIKKVGFRQFYSMINFGIPSRIFEKGILMLGGTTSLFDRGDYYEGDMSGISAKNMPRIASRLYYKPGHKISKSPNWEDRIKLIVKNAPKWDVGTLAGVPAWVQIVLQEIIKTYKLKDIHEIWPNLSVYIHGGVAFDPYKENIQKLLGRSITFIETYMSSEGSFGFQARPGTKGIKLVLNANIFFEFVPFTHMNFEEDGTLKPNAKSCFIQDVKEDAEYAVLLSTCAGAWRYLIGDVIKFVNAKEHEIVITGRTKQFLSLCGEHISVDNLNQAVQNLNQKTGANIQEYTVGGLQHDGLFAHHWFLGCDKDVNELEAKKMIDDYLKEINDDYAVERTAALKEIFITLLPSQVFNDYLKSIGKYGAMNKFPRVMRGEQLKKWQTYLKAHNFLAPVS